MIDPARISTISKKLQAALPTNFANANDQNNYLGSKAFRYNYFKATIKGDYVLTQKHRLTAEPHGQQHASNRTGP